VERRPLSIGELAVHFGLEPVDIEWLLYRQLTGITWSDLIEEIQLLDCTFEQAERLATQLRQSASLYQVALLGEPTGRQR
jgi:hypothetical protein